jgi:hypothetical protein
MAFVEIGDFTGKFEIHTQGTTAIKLADYITRYEESYLVDMLGVELYDLLMVDPEIAPYSTIVEPLKFQENCEIYISRGFKDMLLGFIYFEFQRDMKVQQTVNSAVKIKSNVSDRAGILDMNLYGRFNESMETYKAIQQYVINNSADFPTFQGVERGYIYTAY